LTIEFSRSTWIPSPGRFALPLRAGFHGVEEKNCSCHARRLSALKEEVFAEVWFARRRQWSYWSQRSAMQADARTSPCACSPLLPVKVTQMICSSGPEITLRSLRARTIAYSKGEQYAEKCNTYDAGNGFNGNRKCNASSRDNSPSACSPAAAGKLQLGLPC
jgi:hypothetical protein